MIYPQNFEQKIGFDTIRQLLEAKCLSPLGREKVQEMDFSADLVAVESRLETVEEFIRINEGRVPFPELVIVDTRPALKRIRIEGMFLEEQELFGVRRSLGTIDEVVRFLQKEEVEGAEGTYPHLRSLAETTPTFPQILREIDRILNKFGKIRDDASDQLRNIRRELASTAGSISRTLNAILRSAQTEGVVDKDVNPTVRDGRLVIPIAPALKRKIKGIVHDESATGKTVFIEPAEVVEANNRIRELEGEERREVVRILTEFSNHIRPDIPDLMQAYQFLAVVDFVRAKAQWTQETNALIPHLEAQPIIDWEGAVHPLLQRSLAKHDKKVVPLTILLNGKQRILIISGPNAGGKSVCLKTVGLLQYMLQCGLPIPVLRGSRAGLFESLFIDIGDEQSIEDDLSTYSSHLLNMKNMMKGCNEKTLLLIDEFGSGTEPLIGGALAEAVLKRFHERMAYGVITTHYQNLKHFAENHPGVVNGAMLYDRHLMQALFQLQIGNPGSSFAVEIARKIGLPEEVIADASEIVGSEYIQSDKYLQDIVRDKRYWETKRQTVHQQEKHLEELIGSYETEMEELKKNRKTILKEAQEEAKKLIQDSNARIENTIRAIKEAQADKEQTRVARQELMEFRQAVDEQVNTDLEARINRKMELLRERQNRKKDRQKQRATEKAEAAKQPTPAKPKAEKLQVGSFVRIKGQQTIGQVVELNEKNAIVTFGMMRTLTERHKLEVVSKEMAQQQQEAQPKAYTYISKQTQESISEKKLQFKQDLDVRGMRGTEALQAVTYFIDDAILLNIPRVRILHGTGNGILRTLIREYLHTHPGVADYRDEHVQFGGAGITVVDLG